MRLDTIAIVEPESKAVVEEVPIALVLERVCEHIANLEGRLKKAKRLKRLLQGNDTSRTNEMFQLLREW